jgi:hypothetical protein
MIARRLCALAALLLLVACGGGGGSSSTSSSTGSGSGSTPSTPQNTVAVVVDAGPSGLDSGPDGYIQANVPYVTITLCAPGSTTNCQTIDHVEVDTGSSGLRVLASALGSTLLSALPTQSDTQGDPVGECFAFVDGYVFGSVRQADFTVGAEKVASLALQVIGDTGAFATVPNSCSSGGGPNMDTLVTFGANGILGVGPTATDCDALCETAGGYGAAIYYDCPSSGCGAIIARSAATSAPFQQLPNPVAAMSVDNNGVILSLPSVPAAGETSVTGTLYFGIGTQSNNALGSATVLTATTSASALGPGFITATFNGQTLTESYIDSGTTVLLFDDSSLSPCTDAANSGYYCPASTTNLQAGLQGQTGAGAQVTFTVENADTLLATPYSVLPGLAANPDIFSGEGYSSSFAFGLPFFYGRNVYTAIEGRTAGGVAGPYFAF